ncbi:ubiquitin carboxyl-terminal hydrolase MINDY-1 isoform X2 [Hyla sarda]|nr:ubiquitin carboxyl-terminal hydrolase MINDY-1 isoform X2 [Hyla sarda]XP_056400995.1 ubiquitin carboxyl-terminal hydrolase MINDY-1 isoform X2 [Hyla sarda]XP_056400996.1 ubiquitin carboxyl-terminal hydrolase MINDY-1 isoform X2 [Hyla sarda]XP_056400997.1 ubiquitin carboxyl-terminal hydrolase MINDY-1 isoform X2 [Hyla sarda]XP_056400998.1 ubiquitin carboxyl-terminal hydrolase MINDY-1 isoform X2 [Hyla sarda]XP_056400999.1 ubiquitin carboxyl-terminal hydrolase MINDY-1 isoform X2 [Hyla sarda]
MEQSGKEFNMDQAEEIKATPIAPQQMENCEALVDEKSQGAELRAAVMDSDTGEKTYVVITEAATGKSQETSEEGEASGSSDSSSYSTNTRPSDTQSDGGVEDGNSQSIPESGKPSRGSTSVESEQLASCQTSDDPEKMENPSLQNLLCSSASVSPCEEATESGAAKPAGTEGATGTDYYFVKWINWKGERTPVLTQSENGPCPLIAIMNILFLRWKVKLPPQKELITSEELMAHLGDCILSIQPQENSEALQLNFQQNVNDAMTVLPKLSTGLDVNVRFTGVSDFEYTPECIVFDLLNIPLYHGWLVDPQSSESVEAVGKLSYNQLVEKIITCKHSTDPNLVTEGLLAEQFLESSATQLTYHGLCELMAAVKEGELSVFFRNNHFSTLIKHKGHLYLLVTDQGFLQEEKVIWESLHNVEGDSCFCDSDFHLTQHIEKDPSFSSPQQLQQQQVDQDYMIALSLQQQQQGSLPMSDLELAQQLQKEEYQQQLPPQAPPQSPQQPRPQTSGRQPSERRQRQKDSDCVLL